MNQITQSPADKVRALIQRITGVDLADLTDDATLFGVGADDLEVTEILVRMEEAFGVELGDDAVTGEMAIAAIVAAVAPVEATP